MKKIYILRNPIVLNTVIQDLKNLPIDENNQFKLTIQDVTRTLDQNSLLWPLLECFAKQLKWPVNGAMCYLEAENWKDILSAAFKNESQRIAMGLNGGMVMLGMRTSKMGKKEFSEFIEFIYAIAAERGVIIAK